MVMFQKVEIRLTQLDGLSELQAPMHPKPSLCKYKKGLNSRLMTKKERTFIRMGLNDWDASLEDKREEIYEKKKKKESGIKLTHSEILFSLNLITSLLKKKELRYLYPITGLFILPH